MSFFSFCPRWLNRHLWPVRVARLLLDLLHPFFHLSHLMLQLLILFQQCLHHFLLYFSLQIISFSICWKGNPLWSKWFTPPRSTSTSTVHWHHPCSPQRSSIDCPLIRPAFRCSKSRFHSWCSQPRSGTPSSPFLSRFSPTSTLTSILHSF